MEAKASACREFHLEVVQQIPQRPVTLAASFEFPEIGWWAEQAASFEFLGIGWQAEQSIHQFEFPEIGRQAEHSIPETQPGQH